MADDERTHTVTGSHQRTIVVADDEPLYADAHSRMLADRYDVKTVYSGAAALEAVDDSVDVLLVDRRMPSLSGDELLETLAERGATCRTIVVSAIDPSTDALEVKTDGYLTKPVTQRQLADCIERVLE
ncbi:response regulator [Natrialba swarupiae]|uniref:Response regulator n=1 Tax=Natrialba swarupiae TaxID=2448032 RepID=A0A5D5AS43_9EURY|nr:response regulator [Natrialba swarupiae]TYT63827.1 response regulator [Natrialba swarupiae]